MPKRAYDILLFAIWSYLSVKASADPWKTNRNGRLDGRHRRLVLHYVLVVHSIRVTGS